MLDVFEMYVALNFGFSDSREWRPTSVPAS